MEDLDIYNKLLEEIKGHEFGETIHRCHDATHNTTGYPEGTLNCWRAEVAEFIKLQSCEAVLCFTEATEKVYIKCVKPVHDISIEHEGERTATDTIRGKYTKRVTWRTT